MSQRGILFASSATVALAFAVSAHAAEIHVPGTAPTIQAAIDQAIDGDVVLVAPGTYREAIDFAGKAIEVRSVAGFAVTTLGGDSLGTVVRFDSGESDASLLAGFTIENAALLPGEYGLVTSGASPRIENCRFASLATHVPDCGILGYGLAVRCEGGAPRFVDCVFEDNVVALACAKTQLHGIALAATLGAQVRLERCEVRRQGVSGNGISAHALAVVAASLELVDCAVAANERGAILATDGTLVVRRCRIEDNEDAAIRAGGSSLVTIEFSTLVGNEDAAIDLTGAPQVDVFRSTLAANGSFSEIRAFFFTGAVRVGDSIVWGPLGSAALGWLTPQNLAIDWSNTQVPWPGTSNLSLDPLFVSPSSGDFRLAPGSPSIDAGDPAGPADPDRTWPDQGAHPYEPWTVIAAGVAGSLAGSGALHPNSAFTIALTDAAADAAFVLLVAAAPSAIPLPAGILVAAPGAVIAGLVTDSEGAWRTTGRWPVAAGSGTSLVLQALFPSTSGALPSDALVGTAP
jgi:hypothetical protein